MSVIAEFQKDALILREAMTAVPDVTVRVDGVQWLPDDPTKVHFETSGGDLDAFERALASEPTIESVQRLTDGADARFYTVTLSPSGREKSTYHLVADVDGVVLNMTARNDRAYIRAQFPSREALFAYREACRERDVGFSLDRLYTATGTDETDGERYGLTDPQCEALVTALEMGYFDLPRATTQAAVAAELDISTQALSARLRRGLSNLLRSTLTGNTTT